MLFLCQQLEEEATLVSSIIIPGRPTCMTVYVPMQPKPSKEEASNVEEEISEDTQSPIKKKKKNTSKSSSFLY